ncbi:ATP-binding protein [Albimonas pacifica]|uniref:histidine kinase n=1 Tax=Albimonas pacifica TaxID=1114924 RepID=A0A1I3GYU0_9RHOB|nr:ATP-binding protein [Albimonas pacifica]SFI28477.1 membrane-associated sensor protein [Albimonas pacifica]
MSPHPRPDRSRCAEAPPPASRQGEPQVLLISTERPGRADLAQAGAVVGLLVAALLLVAPSATVRLPGTEPLTAAYVAATLICQMLTAGLLLGVNAVQPTRGLLTLAAGYLFAGAMIVPWGLSFPGAFPALEGAGRLNATATIAAVARLGFPLFVLAYALAPAGRPAGARGPGRGATAAALAAVVAGVAGLGWAVLFTDMPLPPFMRDALHVAPLWRAVPPTAVAICLVAIAALARRFASLLDLWLIVVLISLIIEIALLAWLSGGTRLTLGWWAGRLFGLAAASVVLAVLLIGAARLYARQARAAFAADRARESRLTLVEAISGALAHELRQPLASIGLGAAAGLRWLRRDPPDLREAEAALERILVVGERAAQVIDAVRGSYRGEDADRVRVDVAVATREAIARSRQEAELERVVIRTDLAPDLPPVLIDPLKLQLALVNLMRNAIDAMRDVTSRPRILSVTAAREGEMVAIAVRDTGEGLPEGWEGRLFANVFTTKPEGMGVGLMFCRTIVETAGGRIEAEPNLSHGAVFRIWLPAAE